MGSCCAGDTAEGSDRVDVEEKWGAVWRWWRDRAGRGGGERKGQMEMEGTMTFTAEDEPVFLQDEPEAQRSRTPETRMWTPQSTTPLTGQSPQEWRTPDRPAVPIFRFLPAQDVHTAEAEHRNSPSSPTESTEPIPPFEGTRLPNLLPSNHEEYITSS